MAKSDPVIPITTEDAGESLVEWFRRNSRQLAIGAMAVAAIAAIAFLWRASAVKKEMRASEALAAAQMVVQSGNAALAQSDLQALIRRYDGTSSAIQGRMLLAQVYFSQGKTDEGLRELDAIDSPGLYAASVHGLRGAGLEQAGKPVEAAAAYEEASESADTPGAKANYRADAARAYLAAGNTEAAKRIWTELASDDTSPLSGEAKVRLGELNAKPAG